MMRTWPVLLVLLACGGDDDDLDPDVVTTLPPGDATGDAASGRWELVSLTTACRGTCATTVNGFSISACDVGTRIEESAQLTQQGGALVIDVPRNDYVSRLAGGIDADGSYDVGGLRTQNGGQVRITARSRGTIAGDTMTGSVRLLVVGMGLECFIDVDAEGERDS
jgi:hypothetical protein